MSKRLKKLVTSISLALAIISMCSITAFAQSNTIEGFKKEYMAHAENRETAFTLNYTGDSTELTYQLDKILADETKNDEYLEASWMTKGASTTGVNGNLNVAVKMTYVETKAQLDYVDKKVEAIVSSVIKPGMTEMEKAYALQDYVCNITVYDSTLVKKSAYNALTDGKTVCRGYAMLMYKLYEKAGIPVHIVQGTAFGGGHAWNMFEVDGNWYYLDATNNDASGNRLEYFGLSENSLKSYGFAWTQGSLPASSSNLTSDNGDLIAISKATTAVTDVENIKTQVSIDSANSLVGALTDGAYKTALQERITAVQTALNVANDQVATAGLAVDKAETSLITADELSAEKLVNTLPESAIKTNYITRLKYVKQEISAMAAVTNAETKKTQSYVDSAVKLVTALTDSNLKTSLQSRIKTVQETLHLHKLLLQLMQWQKQRQVYCNRI